MEPTVEKIGDVTVATVNADALDASNAENFREDMSPILAGCRKLVLDLGRVQFMDSRGCGAVLSCLKRLSEAGGDLKLCHTTQIVRTVLELMRIHRICQICATREEAVKAFQA
ncbi:MAG: STAS domain-containing protein [Gemmataceae bacterium]|nr:STAS domain-containing protein [Gemmataceae bacterium]